MSKRIITIILVSLISLTCAFGSFASEIATSSNAQLNIATSSNAMPSDDFLESDGFDTLDVPVLLSSGESVVNTIKYSGAGLGVYYYDMNGVTHEKYSSFSSSGYASISAPSDLASIIALQVSLNRQSLPSPGTYLMSVHFGSNTGVVYDSAYIFTDKVLNNTTGQQLAQDINFQQSSGDWYTSLVVDIGNISNLQISVRPHNKSASTLPYGGYLSVSFTPTDSEPSYTGAGGSYTSSDATQDIANNSAQQVEQGDTIIELIKNTIQTISSQLTAFWNQLAGEFTNLFNKMNQQHSEQLQADRENTDDIIFADDANTNKVTTAIESHGNFIIEGLKKLFIPSDEYFKAYFDDLYSWFSERFGFLSFPIDLLLEVIDIFANSSQTDCVLVLPSFTIMDNLLWPEMSFNLTEFLDTNFSFVVVAIKTVTSIYLVMAFVQLCEEKWNEVMMN